MMTAWERISAVFLEKPLHYRLESGPCCSMPALLLSRSGWLGVHPGSIQEVMRKSTSICVFTGPEDVSTPHLSQQNPESYLMPYVCLLPLTVQLLKFLYS